MGELPADTPESTDGHQVESRTLRAFEANLAAANAQRAQANRKPPSPRQDVSESNRSAVSTTAQDTRTQILPKPTQARVAGGMRPEAAPAESQARQTGEMKEISKPVNPAMRTSHNDLLALEFKVTFSKQFTPQELSDLLSLLRTDECREHNITIENILSDPDRDAILSELNGIAKRVYRRNRALPQPVARLAIPATSSSDQHALEQARPAQEMPAQPQQRTFWQWLFGKPADPPAAAPSKAALDTMSRREFLKMLLSGAAVAWLGIRQQFIPERPEIKALRLQHLKERVNKLLRKLKEPVTQQLWFRKEALMLDGGVLAVGSELTAADVQRIREMLIKARWSNSQAMYQPGTTTRYVNTMRLLASAKGAWPQATRYRIIEQDKDVTLIPIPQRK